MTSDSEPAIAWVESPLQLVSAAEWAASRLGPVAVAFRLTSSQMTNTAAELLARGARFSRCAPYYGIPWQLLSGHKHWAIGDAFSGQFRLAGSVLRPSGITLLDDGGQVGALADAILGSSAYSRPGQRESGIATILGGIVRDRMSGLAASGRLHMSTAFSLGTPRLAAMAARGIDVSSHRFEWVRSTARPIAVPGNRVLLGSALPTDGRMPVPDYLAWVRREAANGRVAYLPHRRETRATMDAVARIPGVRIFDSGLPIELVLAGATDSLEVVTLPTSATRTLGLLLEGTGSVIHTRAGRREAARS